jgi:membrane-bound lytic murein transglycosylase
VSGLGLAQDKGAAIKGRRLDYYVGEGQKAGAMAQNIHATTAIHLLVSREALLQ